VYTADTYTGELLERRDLGPGTYEIRIGRPEGFRFRPGQRIRLSVNDQERDYSIASSPEDRSLALCIRRVRDGVVSSHLYTVAIGRHISFSGPHGYFVYQDSERPAVFVATGTGAAPFASMARSNARGFTMIHGVKHSEDLCYAELFRSRSRKYVACVSGYATQDEDHFSGRVTDYMETVLESGFHDFYLCGRGEMVRDAMWLIDRRFNGSSVYTEVFF
jgi:NAD(P)H-flavin reductase